MSQQAAKVLRVTDWHSVRKVVYYDTYYPASWVNNGAELAEAFVAAGYAPVSAPQLADWMRAQVTGGAEGSICFFARDIVPETVADVCTPDALLVQYMRAGGRAVWVGDMPFYYQGRRLGGRLVWGVHGQKAALGLESAWDLQEQVTITSEGTQWGLTAPDTPARCVPAKDVTAAFTLAGRYAVSFFKNYNPEFPFSGLVRLREYFPAQDLLRAAQYGIEEEELEAAAAPGPEDPEEGAELVSSGTFVVDRARALDKLMRFQLPDPQTALLPLARCAEAAGASTLEIKEAPGGLLTVNFGGVCFTREQLADPYAALFEPRSKVNAPARHLATALLCLLRLRPAYVTVSSGPAGERYRLKVDRLGSEALQPSESPGGDTFVRIAWGGLLPGVQSARLLKHIGARCQFSPLGVVVNGEQLSRQALSVGSEAGGLEFVSGQVRGYIEAPPWPAEASALTVLVNGVSLDTPLTVRLRGLQVRGRIDSPDFTMNISQTGVVNNTRCSRAVGAVAAQVPVLVEHISGRQERTLHVAGRMAVRGGLESLWKERMSGASPMLPGLLGGLVKGVSSLLFLETNASLKLRENAELTVASTAASTRWLQEGCAALLTTWEQDCADRLLRALWSAPVFLTVNCAARSMREVDAQRRKLGFVPYSYRPEPDATLPFDTLWCSGYRELALLRRWETVDITRKVGQYGRNQAAAEEFMGLSASGLVAMRHDVEIVPPDRAARRVVELKLEVQHEAAPAPAQKKPESQAKPPPAPPPAPPPSQPKAPKVSGKPSRQARMLQAEELAANPAVNFPEYLARRLFSDVDASGARLLAQYIREQAVDPGWMKKKLRADILSSDLPPLRKAEYLLSVFYTELNRREVRFTDSDDIRFQQALTDMILRVSEKD